MSTRYYSNCWIEARFEYRRLLRAWTAAGAVPGYEPVYLKRPSHHYPQWIKHHLVGFRDPSTGQYRVRSFKPVRPIRAPWYLIWTRALFLGEWVEGDDPPQDSHRPRARDGGRHPAPAGRDGAQVARSIEGEQA